MKATPQRKARRTGLTGRGRVRRNLWPFSAFKTSTTYHVKAKRGPATSGAGTFKGHRIEKRPDGGFVVPSIDRYTVLDDKRQAKRFITEQTKYNAGRKSKVKANSRRFPRLGPEAKIVPLNAARFRRDILPRLREPMTLAEYRKQYGPLWLLYSYGSLVKTAGTKAELTRSAYDEQRALSHNPSRRKAAKAPKRKTKNAARRKNAGADPLAAAVKSYKGFHGRPPSKILKVSERVHVPDSHLPGLGDLQSICIRHVGGRKKTDLDFGRGVVLCRNVKKTQLFIRGGDQSAPLAVFGIEKPYHDQEVLGEALSVDYFTTKDHLAPEDGGTATYRHKFGRKKPTIVYSVPDKKLSFAGGGYTIPDEGIDL